MTTIWGATQARVALAAKLEDDTAIIDGRAYMSLFHHDGRFMRGPGRFAFVQKTADGQRTILHHDVADNISRVAGPNHPAWRQALADGMNELLVCLGPDPRRGEPGSAEDLALAIDG